MNKNGFIKLLFLLLLGGICLLGALYTQYQSYWEETPLAHLTKTDHLIEIEKGDSLYNSTKLSQKGLDFSNKWFVKAWLKLNSKGKPLKIGEYALKTSWTRSEILKHLLFGPPHQRFFTFREGHNIWELRDLLKQNLHVFDEKLFWQSIRNPNLITKHIGINVPKSAESLEGFLFPETYSFEKQDTAQTVLVNMLKLFKKRALPLISKHSWRNEDHGIFRLVTLASIIEKESGNFHEQPLISSVFWNRLEKGMRLQSDPTTIYALFPNFDGNLRRVHLNETTPYNTYRIKELPIGPISNPGESALKAVVSPKSTDYFFFVSKGNGEHIFSKTYKEHLQYVRKYQLKK